MGDEPMTYGEALAIEIKKRLESIRAINTDRLMATASVAFGDAVASADVMAEAMQEGLRMSRLNYGQLADLDRLKPATPRPRIKLTAYQLSRFPKRHRPSHGFHGKAYHRSDGALVIALPHEHDPEHWLTWTAFDVDMVAHPVPCQDAMSRRALIALLAYHRQWPASAPFGRRHPFPSEWLAGSRETRARAKQRQSRRVRVNKRGW